MQGGPLCTNVYVEICWAVERQSSITRERKRERERSKLRVKRLEVRIPKCFRDSKFRKSKLRLLHNAGLLRRMLQ